MNILPNICTFGSLSSSSLMLDLSHLTNKSIYILYTFTLIEWPGVHVIISYYSFVALGTRSKFGLVTGYNTEVVVRRGASK